MVNVPALLVRLTGPGFEREYCFDVLFMESVLKRYRAVLFVYPKHYCEEARNLPAEQGAQPLSAERALTMLVSACQDALSVKNAYAPSFTRMIKRLLFLQPSKEDIEYAEAHYANELCNTIFADKNPSSISIAWSVNAAISYRVGDKSDDKWIRLAKIARIDNGVLRKLEELLGSRGLGAE